MTDDFTPNEDELRRMLGSADRPRALSDDELTRIRGRVEGLGASRSPATAADHVKIPEHAAAPLRSNPFRGRVIAVAAAAIILVVGLVVFSGGDDAGEVELADDPEALVQTPLEQACTREIARLTSAIEAWDGIGNWALTQNGEPAIDGLAADALLALARIEGLESGAADALRALDADLAAAQDLLQAQARTARTAAVTGAAQAVLDLVAGHPNGAGCDLSRLAARVGG